MVTKSKSVKTEPVQTEAPKSFFENYGSTLLGFVVVLILGSFIFNVLRGGTKPKEQGQIGSGEETQQETVKEVKEGQTHTVAKGEDLWKISEKYYGSGYNWVDIVKANKLANANVIEEGQTLAIPQVTPIVLKKTQIETTVTPTPTTTEKTEVKQAQVSGDSYTVVKGDNLWKIAEKVYNDGYQWVKIAQANKLVHPSLIHVGNTLSIPR